MNEDFTYVGFEPTTEEKSLAKKIYWQLEENAPVFAAKTAVLKKSGNEYIGQIKIASHAGNFLAEAQSQCARDVIQQLSDKMIQQLKHWKQSRK